MTDTARVRHNDWSSLDPPSLAGWRPTQRVSVVIPAYQCQPSLVLLLASLAQQSYPADLFDVVVVDDGSEPRLRLPAVRPEATRLVWVPDHTDDWGIANACNIGARESAGEIILRLDADLVVLPRHIEAHARWHHLVPYAVTLGAKRFVDVHPDRPGWPSVAGVVRAGSAERLFDRASTEPHAYVEKLSARTDQLRSADHLAFLAYVGATTAMRRELFDAAGGYASGIRRGSDTEFGYRLGQAGAVFIPEPQADSWHLGPSSMMRDRDALQRYSRPFLAEVMPYPRWLRKAGGSAWAVPLVTVVVDVSGQSLEQVRATVDAVLRGDERDLRVLLVGPWKALAHEPRRVLADPLLDLRLIAASYRADPRVHLVEAAPDTVFPSPHLLEMGAGVIPGRASIRYLVAEADRAGAAILTVVGPDQAPVATLTRTSACSRVAWYRRPDETLRSALGESQGGLVVTAAAAGMATAGANFGGAEGNGKAAITRRPRLPAPEVVEVGGLRSWLRATGLVTRLGVRRIMRLAGRRRR